MPTKLDAGCPVCGSDESGSVTLPANVVGPCTLFECGRCMIRYLGTWTDACPDEEDYWSDPETGLAIYTAPDVVEELSAKYRAALSALAPGLGAGARVLDVGCGVGTFLAVARERGFEATGVDIAPVVAKVARERFGHDARGGSLEEQDFPDATFDLVTLWDVIEHVFDPRALLAEVRRVLKPGGLLLLETPDEGTPLRLAARVAYRTTFGRVRIVTGCYYPAHRIYFTRPGLASLLRRMGFEEPEVRRESSMRAKSRRKSRSYGMSVQGAVDEVAFALMRVAPFLKNKIVAASRRAA